MLPFCWFLVRHAVRFGLHGESDWFFLPCGREAPPSSGVWDASPAWGRGGLLGAAPLLGPLCTPPGTPPKKGFQHSSCGEGNATIAAGASFPRYAHSGDLPPRRVNARVRFRSGWNPFQPNTADTLPEKDIALHRFQGISKISIITNLTDSGRKAWYLGVTLACEHSALNSTASRQRNCESE